MYDQQPRRRLRLPQLAKFNRRIRRQGQRSEFIIMCHNVAFTEQVKRDHIDRARREAEHRRAKEAAA